MILIKNGHIKPMVGEDIENGCVLIGDDGKIKEVGVDVNAPDGAEIIDAKGRLVTPGLVEAHCHSGVEDPICWETKDNNEVSDPITPQMRVIDSFNPQDSALFEAVQYGVTSACTGPGSANVIGGTFGAFKLVGNRADDMVIKFPVAMKCAFGENPKRIYGQQQKKSPGTRMGVAALFRDFLFKSKNYFEEKEKGNNPVFDMKYEAMIPVFKKEIPLKAHVHRADDILTAVRIAKEFDLNLTLDHCTEGGLIADELLKEGYPCIIGPSFGSKSKQELKHKGFETAAILNNKGINVSITTDAPVLPLKCLPLLAGLAAAEGLPENAAWEAITINPAKLADISDRVGTLEAGTDADVVIWTANPMTAIGARAYIAIIDGKVVHKA